MATIPEKVESTNMVIYASDYVKEKLIQELEIRGKNTLLDSQLYQHFKHVHL